jgi:hypothetical protein
VSGLVWNAGNLCQVRDRARVRARARARVREP